MTKFQDRYGMLHDQIIDYLTQNQQDQLQFLQKLVLQTSHTADKRGVDRVGNLICQALAECGMNVQRQHQQEVGDNLVFSSPACTPGTVPILMVGHMDTVYPTNSPFHCFHQDHDTIIGPGVIDMKGGLACAIYILKALHARGLLAQIPLRLLCNSDEETGSLYSKDLIRAYGEKSLCGLVFECGGLHGEIVTGRKGQTSYRIQVHGQAGHAAFTLKNGKASAIKELARMILELEALNNAEKDIVINVGLVSGGSGVNVVPEHASAAVDSRYTTREASLVVARQISSIATHCQIQGTSSTLEVINSCPPMEQRRGNRALYSMAAHHAIHLGIPVREELRSGLSDANILAECNIPVLDGLGPCGDCDHCDQEYLLTESLLQKTILSSFCIIDLWQHGLSA